MLKERLIQTTLALCAGVSVLTTFAIIFFIGWEVVLFFQEVSWLSFLTDTEWTPLFSERRFGIWPLLCGTFLTSMVALLIALPFGLLIAIYLSEFATSSIRKSLKPLLELLAGVPTIVYGYFALTVVTPLLQRFIPELSGFNALGPGIVMGFMILPMVASLSEDALFSVPSSFREGAYALGATRLQMIFRVLLPAGLGGITASFILAASRAVGETMIVAVAAGQQPILTLNPLSPVETMTAFIVQVSLGDTPYGSLEYKTIFAVSGTLFLITFFLNGVSLFLRERFQSRYS
jgi:phosphate transport system permease protein